MLQSPKKETKETWRQTLKYCSCFLSFLFFPPANFSSTCLGNTENYQTMLMYRLTVARLNADYLE